MGDRCVAVMRRIIPILPIVPQAQEVSLDQVQDSLDPQPEGEVLFTASLQEQLLLFTKKKNIISIWNHIKKKCARVHAFTVRTLQNLFQGIWASGSLAAFEPVGLKQRRTGSSYWARQGSVSVCLSYSVLTQQFVSQHAQLLSVQATLGDGGELPTQHLGQLPPTHRGRVHEERQVLKEKNRCLKGFTKLRTFSLTQRKNSGGVAYLGVRDQHVVPHDRGPTTWQLANIGDHHNRQRWCLTSKNHMITWLSHEFIYTKISIVA